jgi:hypothetical protein
LPNAGGQELHVRDFRVAGKGIIAQSRALAGLAHLVTTQFYALNLTAKRQVLRLPVKLPEYRVMHLQIHSLKSSAANRPSRASGNLQLSHWPPEPPPIGKQDSVMHREFFKDFALPMSSAGKFVCRFFERAAAAGRKN